MIRTDIINYYLDRAASPKFYLEIGIRNLNDNFDRIRADHKDGVDPNPACKSNYVMTSDVFFSRNTTSYDLVFIDGLHSDEQVTRDILSSLKFIKDKGTIVLHDCNPPTERSQKLRLNGTVWKAFVKFRMEREDLEMFVIDTDCGVGVIKPNSKQKNFQCAEDIYNYKIFNKYRKEALNLISIDEFKKKKT